MKEKKIGVYFYFSVAVTNEKKINEKKMVQNLKWATAHLSIGWALGTRARGAAGRGGVGTSAGGEGQTDAQGVTGARGTASARGLEGEGARGSGGARGTALRHGQLGGLGAACAHLGMVLG